MNRRSMLGLFAGVAMLAACGAQTNQSSEAGAGEVNLYSARHYDGDKEVLARFTEETGIRVNVIEGRPDELVARIQSEGEASPADLFVAADAGAMWRAQQANLFQPTQSDALTAAIPAQYRDPEGRWYGFARRARIVAYDNSKVRPDEVDTYEKLASPRFRGKLCVRSSDSVYNLSLLGALIEAWGPQRAEEWARGIVANMARPPEGGDRDQIRAVGAGVCEVAITNSYYYIRMANGEDAGDRAITERVKLAFPSLDGQGAHVNVAAGGVLARAPHRDNAVRLLEYLASADGQTRISRLNNEYPASPNVPAPDPVAVHANFTAHPMPAATFAARQPEAQSIMSRVSWR